MESMRSLVEIAAIALPKRSQTTGTLTGTESRLTINTTTVSKTHRAGGQLSQRLKTVSATEYLGR